MHDLNQIGEARAKLSIIIAAAIAITAFIGLGLYLVFTVGEDKDTIKTPTLVGSNISKAREIAQAHGLKIEIDAWLFDKTHPINEVISQKPLPNKPIRKGDRIIVRVSSGNDRKNARKSDEKSARKSIAVDEDLKPLPTPPLEPQMPTPNVQRYVIVIDAGHQSHANLEREPIGPGAKETKEKCSGGTRGAISKTPEYKVTLEIAMKLKTKLEAKGLKVVMTRDKNDVNLSNIERANIANSACAALFVRIHADGDADPTKNGISTLYPAPNNWTALIHQESFNAARIIQKNVVAFTKHEDNGIVARSDLTGFNWSKVPTVLVETGFMTNPEEDAALNDPSYQDRLAAGICQGIVDYLQGRQQ
ncbi:MAG: N-acetylmuramoyl-L-alanine amidase [Firmicutes bacterium]|nr:N-acetylmuramoyl-L-alanine amidase [Bacillota bacterium]